MIPTAHAWNTNAELIAAVFTDLLPTAGLWLPGEPVFDPTYHDGLWWLEHPENFTYRTRRQDPMWDFRLMPFRNDQFAATTFDPPYSAKGGRDTSGVKDMDDRYGLVDVPGRPDDLLAMNIGGLAECCRVTTFVILMKSMDFVTGGELHTHTRHLEDAAAALGWSVYDRLIHLPTGGRPQPGGRAELRSRGRPSTLTILTPHKYRKGIKKRMVKIDGAVSLPGVKMNQ